jgi:Family of unknown function (DUF6812)
VSRADEKRLEAKKVRIKLEDGSIIQGCVNLHAELHKDKGAFFNRISDLFTQGESPFIVVFDCTFSAGQQKVLIVSKKKILWVCPRD